MSLRVVGAGFGRTGTLSLKLALERLGFAPCYHMFEVLENPSHDAVWLEATRGKKVDWDALFTGYVAAVDWPVAAFWRELSAHYPEAKVILSVRDAQKWYRSVQNTIYKAMMSPVDPGGRVTSEHRAMARELVLERTFQGRFTDREHAIGVYERHNQMVRDTVPAHRLLVYETGTGWEPLCTFLRCPIPDEPYPLANTTAEFRSRNLRRDQNGAGR